MIQSIQAPTLVIIEDTDIVLPEHAVEMFRLLGGHGRRSCWSPEVATCGASGHNACDGCGSLDWLIPMITEFLDAPMPE
jgi:hypothetical protein